MTLLSGTVGSDVSLETRVLSLLARKLLSTLFELLCASQPGEGTKLHLDDGIPFEDSANASPEGTSLDGRYAPSPA